MSKQDESTAAEIDRRRFLKIAGAAGAAMAAGADSAWARPDSAATTAPSAEPNTAAGGVSGGVSGARAGAAPSTAPGAEAAGGQKPNIIVIVVDDWGYADLGVQGGTEIPTPHVDAFARSGVRFTNGYATGPICSPSRCGLITGRYQQRYGADNNMPLKDYGLPLDQVTMADMLRSAGYVTGCMGKWHLGMDEKFQPLQRGFDEFFGFLHARHSYNYNEHEQFRIYRGNTPTPAIDDDKDYLTDAFTREAVSFIERHHDRPFFIYLPFNAVHFPLEAPTKYTDPFVHIKDERRRMHAGMVTGLDAGIGALVAKLKQLSIDDNTLIFLTADHGGPTWKTTAVNLPLRGFKAQLLEGGIRVPFMARWPAMLAAGKTYDHPIISLDIMSTVAAVTGAAPPPKLEGVNLMPHLTAVDEQAPRNDQAPHDVLCWRFGGQHAVRAGDWKLVKGPKKNAHWPTDDSHLALYNLSNDIGETKDLSASEPAKATELASAYDAWNKLNVNPLW